ncbi:hypothetical protein NGM37_49555, partial [Streptomyces sp. TRM76130]|nr:hypothetical protein [Streptomyces sp. TRM76130]
MRVRSLPPDRHRAGRPSPRGRTAARGRELPALPVSTWRCLWQPETVRHLGPMAQDWYAAFGLGGSDKRIDVVDGLTVSR